MVNINGIVVFFFEYKTPEKSLKVVKEFKGSFPNLQYNYDTIQLIFGTTTSILQEIFASMKYNICVMFADSKVV